MSYTVLARRYRSQSFDEVVGQEHVARTLRNAIDQDRTAHAYLFVGTRGVGKTSMARLFAKALNANEGEEREAIARTIMSGEDVEVIEIDAASPGGVDDARELISNATYRPMRGPYKIYIIDEVHMLSREAFNALLKTMEEPPEHVKFILCTTEANKVPATIQSRCQRFDFRAINTDAIAVARLGHGSMRDALAILDRLLAALEPGQTLDLELLQRLLGLPERQVMNNLIGAFADNDPAAAMSAGDELRRRGIAIDQLLISLADSLRDLMVVSLCGPGSALVDVAESQRQEMAELAARFDPAALVHMIALVESVGLSMKHAISDGQSGEPRKKSLKASAPSQPAPPTTPRISPEPSKPEAKPEPEPRPKPAPKPAKEKSPADPAKVWEAVSAIANERPAMRALFRELKLTSLRHGVATLGVLDPSYDAVVKGRQEQIAEIFQRVVGAPVRVDLALARDTAPAPAPGPIDESINDDPIIRQAKDLFGGTVVSVETDTND